jgi:hypothetical protein
MIVWAVNITTVRAMFITTMAGSTILQPIHGLQRPPAPAPRPLVAPLQFWTGDEMIVWGGFYFDGTNNHELNSGSRLTRLLTSGMSCLTAQMFQQADIAMPRSGQETK